MYGGRDIVLKVACIGIAGDALWLYGIGRCRARDHETKCDHHGDDGPKRSRHGLLLGVPGKPGRRNAVGRCVCVSHPAGYFTFRAAPELANIAGEIGPRRVMARRRRRRNGGAATFSATRPQAPSASTRLARPRGSRRSTCALCASVGSPSTGSGRGSPTRAYYILWFRNGLRNKAARPPPPTGTARTPSGSGSGRCPTGGPPPCGSSCPRRRRPRPPPPPRRSRR